MAQIKNVVNNYDVMRGSAKHTYTALIQRFEAEEEYRLHLCYCMHPIMEINIPYKLNQHEW